ncbi:MAG: hypothetical protein HY762_06205 [Planctomycetes bacterium]|nr:hypothetical protein [Planctomycetota bacterium]
MFFPECERLASRHPDLKDIIIRIDELLSSCGHSSVFNPDDIASLFGERESRIRGVFEGLVKTGLVQEVKYLECPECETLLEIASREKAIEKEEDFECTQCQKDLSGLALTETTRYRLNPAIKNVRISQPVQQSAPKTEPSPKIYSYVITENDRQDLTQELYKNFIGDVEKNHSYDMFIDGVRDNRPCYKKDKNGKIKKSNLTIIGFAITREYIETGKAMLPGATESIKQYNKAAKEAKEARGGRLDKEKIGDGTALDYLEDARRKVDINLGQGKGFRAFKRGKEISISTASDIFQFKPPPDLKYALICPAESLSSTPLATDKK